MFFSNLFFSKKMVYEKNALLQTVTSFLFYRLIVATHIVLIVLMGLLQLTAKTKSIRIHLSGNKES